MGKINGNLQRYFHFLPKPDIIKHILYYIFSMKNFYNFTLLNGRHFPILRALSKHSPALKSKLV